VNDAFRLVNGFVTLQNFYFNFITINVFLINRTEVIGCVQNNRQENSSIYCVSKLRNLNSI